MAAQRGVIVGLAAVAAGAGYYLYQAGGDPDVAQKKLEADAQAAKAKVQGESAKAEKDAKAAGEKLDSAASKAKAEGKDLAADAQQKLDQARKETGSELKKAADTFDKTVSEGTAKAKSGISSWFGGGK